MTPGVRDPATYLRTQIGVCRRQQKLAEKAKQKERAAWWAGLQRTLEALASYIEIDAAAYRLALIRQRKAVLDDVPRPPPMPTTTLLRAHDFDDEPE